MAFGAIDLSGNLPRGTADGRDSESVAGTSSYLQWTPPLFHHFNVHFADLKAVVETIKTRVEAATIMASGSLRTTIRDITPIS